MIETTSIKNCELNSIVWIVKNVGEDSIFDFHSVNISVTLFLQPEIHMIFHIYVDQKETRPKRGQKIVITNVFSTIRFIRYNWHPASMLNIIQYRKRIKK